MLPYGRSKACKSSSQAVFGTCSACDGPCAADLEDAVQNESVPATHFWGACNPPPLARASPKFQNLTESTPAVALTRALFVRAVRRPKRWVWHRECTSRQAIPQPPPGSTQYP